MKCLVGAALMLFVATAAAAQHHGAAPGAAATSVSPCRRGYEDAKEYKNLRIVKMPVTTPNDEARDFFNQGMTLLYAFNHEEAVLAFGKAARLDNDFAMAHWGIALAVGPNINAVMDEACRIVAASEVVKAEQAEERRKDTKWKVTDLEDGFIKALKPRYTGRPTFAIDYRLAMAQLARDNPNDPDVLSLYAESIMDLDPWGHYEQEAADLLKRAIKIDTNHIGANHYLIHALEAGLEFKDEQVVRSANLLRDLHLKAGHLAHMPSHIYMRLGRYHDASESNAEAVAIDTDMYDPPCKQSIRAPGCLQFYYGHYRSHNLSFRTAALSMEGRRKQAFADAEKTSRHAERFVADEVGLEHYIVTEWITWVNFREWSKILERKPPFFTASCDEGLPQKGCHLATAMVYWARGMAFAATGRPADADGELRMFGIERSQISGVSWGNNHPDSVLNIADILLRARIFTANCNLAAAIDALRAAVSLDDGLSYDEPPPWLYPARQSLGGALIQAGRNEEAKEVFRADLDPNRNPNNGRALFGLARALEKLKDPTWREIQALYEKAWEEATKEGFALDLEDLWGAPPPAAKCPPRPGAPPH